MVVAAFDSLSADQQSEVVMARIKNIPREVAIIITGYCGHARELGAVLLGHTLSGKTTIWNQLILQCGLSTATETALHIQWKSKEETKRREQLTTKPYHIHLPSVTEFRKVGQQHAAQAYAFAPPDTNTHTVRLWDCDAINKYYKNFVMMIGRAVVAVLVIPAPPQLFTKAINPDSGFVREHLILAFARGIRRLVVAITRMDEVGYDEKAYLQRLSDIEVLIRKIGFKPENVCYVPVVGLTGENITGNRNADRSAVASAAVNAAAALGQSGGSGGAASGGSSELYTPLRKWYSGPSLFRALCQMISDTPLPDMFRPLRFSIYESYFIPVHAHDKTNMRLCVTGYVESGCVFPDQKIKLEPVPATRLAHDSGLVDGSTEAKRATARISVCPAKIISLRKGVHDYQRGYPGDYIGMMIEGVPPPGPDTAYYAQRDRLSARDVRGSNHKHRAQYESHAHMISELAADCDPAYEADYWQAQIATFFVPNRIAVGYKPTMVCGNYYGPVVLTNFLSLLDRKNPRTVLQPNPQFLNRNETAMVQMQALPGTRCVVEPYSAYPSLGAFALVDNTRVIAIGIITQVWKKTSGGSHRRVVENLDAKQKATLSAMAKSVRDVKIGVSQQIAQNKKQVAESARKREADLKRAVEQSMLRIAQEASVLSAAAEAPDHPPNRALGDVKDVPLPQNVQPQAKAIAAGSEFPSAPGGPSASASGQHPIRAGRSPAGTPPFGAILISADADAATAEAAAAQQHFELSTDAAPRPIASASAPQPPAPQPPAPA